MFNPYRLYTNPYKEPVDIDLISVHFLMDVVVNKHELDSRMCRLIEYKLEYLVKSLTLVKC